MHRSVTHIVLFLLLPVSVCCAQEEKKALTWLECVFLAQKNHPDLISAQENVKEAQASLDVTASGQYPQASATAGVSTSHSRTKDDSTGSTSTATTNAYSYGASASQLLFDGSKTSSKVSAGRENVNVAQQAFRYASVDVRQRLRSAFISVLKGQESVKIMQEIFDIRRSNLELITLRYESGTEHRGALLSAQANSAQAAHELAQARRALESARYQLIKEMGVEQYPDISVTGDFEVSVSLKDKPDMRAITDNHPSVQKLAAQTRAASFGIKVNEADFWPALSITAGANKTGAHWPPHNSALTTGLSLSWPFLEGGLRQAQVAQSRSQLIQAQADQRSGRSGVLLTLEQKWAALQDAVENVAVQRRFLAAAEERSAIAEAQYSMGLLKFDNWTIIEDNLVSAKKTFIDAQANALLAEANWIMAKGETLEYN
ncbi:MAG TPA: TolC family protein [Candidatus Omnitrophota bacterium]|nr:TolC family protein [Candidatus Omnitrophota bacterium]